MRMGLRAQETHYEVLGLDPSAPSQTVRTAVDRLAEEANALAYSAPNQASRLWERVHQIDADLLAGEARRAAYDRMLPAAGPRAEGPIVPERLAMSAPPAVHRVSPARREPSAFWLALAGGAAVLLAAAAAALLVHAPSPSRGQHAAAMALFASGARRGNGYASGQQVTLHWNAVRGAARYGVQVATSSRAMSDSALARLPRRIISTTRHALRWRVVGAQIYYWRVRPYVGGRWKPYSAWHTFIVARPVVGIPSLLTPENGAMRVARHVTLCWLTVPNSVGYRLRVDGMPARTLSSTCSTIAVRPATYTWSVAAQVRGVQVYTGPYSDKASFTVVPRPILVATRVEARHTHTASAVRSARRPAHRTSALPSSRAVSHPVVQREPARRVALALPVRPVSPVPAVRAIARRPVVAAVPRSPAHHVIGRRSAPHRSSSHRTPSHRLPARKIPVRTARAPVWRQPAPSVPIVPVTAPPQPVAAVPAGPANVPPRSSALYPSGRAPAPTGAIAAATARPRATVPTSGASIPAPGALPGPSGRIARYPVSQPVAPAASTSACERRGCVGRP